MERPLYIAVQSLARRSVQAGAQQQAPAVKAGARGGSAAHGEPAAAAGEEGLPREEVFRRLRALEQPVTLFGEVRCAAVRILPPQLFLFIE